MKNDQKILLMVFNFLFRTINVIDNMITMLEQHAEHLEELVEERTLELGDEKKKVETLLYNILPR